MTGRPVLLSLALALGCLASAHATAQNQAWVTVADGDGRLWGRFLPGEEPYEPGCGPGVGERVRGLKTPQGEPIDTLDLVGWRDGDVWRIVVYAVLADQRGSESGCADGRRKREIAIARVATGGQAVLTPMARLGVKPWRVAVVLR